MLEDDKREVRKDEPEVGSEEVASGSQAELDQEENDAIPPPPEEDESSQGDASPVDASPVEDSPEQDSERGEDLEEVGEGTTDEGDETPEVSAEEAEQNAADMDEAAVEFLEARMESMKAELDAVRSELARSEEAANGHAEARARLQADFDNYRRRQVRDIERAQDERVEKLLIKVLPVYDTFGRAIDQYEKDNSEEALYDGLQRIEKQFQQLLEGMGITQIEAQGKPFDPNLHEALCRVPVPEDGFDEMVVAVFETGYIYKERVIKPARVSVGKE